MMFPVAAGISDGGQRGAQEEVVVCPAGCKSALSPPPLASFPPAEHLSLAAQPPDGVW